MPSEPNMECLGVHEICQIVHNVRQRQGRPNGHIDVSSNLRKEIAMQSAVVKNVVLVHGGFVDGSGWQGVYKALTKSGHSVTVVQNPTISLADDVAVTRRAI